MARFPTARGSCKKYEQQWQRYDTVNATIGQGYMLANPLQLAVMAARHRDGHATSMPHLAAEQGAQARTVRSAFPPSISLSSARR